MSLSEQSPDPESHVVDRPEDLVLDLGEPFSDGERRRDFHLAEPSQIGIVGYQACINDWCGLLVMKAVAYKTEGFCEDCYRKEFRDRVTELEIAGVGARVPIRGARPSKKKKNARTKPSKTTLLGLKKAAARRARSRLAQAFPEIYQAFLAEERAKVGLDPFTIDAAIHHDQDRARATMDFAEVYAALKRAEVMPDGLDVQPEEAGFDKPV